MREPRSGGKAGACSRTKFAREAELECKNAHETLAQKDSAQLATSIELLRRRALGTRKSVRRAVARTPNRDFCNKKIFRGNPADSSAPIGKLQFWRRIEDGRFATARAIKAIDRQTSSTIGDYREPQATDRAIPTRRT
jgi:hypothetical protein